MPTASKAPSRKHRTPSKDASPKLRLPCRDDFAELDMFFIWEDLYFRDQFFKAETDDEKYGLAGKIRDSCEERFFSRAACLSVSERVPLAEKAQVELRDLERMLKEKGCKRELPARKSLLKRLDDTPDLYPCLLVAAKNEEGRRLAKKTLSEADIPTVELKYVHGCVLRTVFDEDGRVRPKVIDPVFLEIFRKSLGTDAEVGLYGNADQEMHEHVHFLNRHFFATRCFNLVADNSAFVPKVPIDEVREIFSDFPKTVDPMALLCNQKVVIPVPSRGQAMSASITTAQHTDYWRDDPEYEACLAKVVEIVDKPDNVFSLVPTAEDPEIAAGAFARLGAYSCSEAKTRLIHYIDHCGISIELVDELVHNNDFKKMMSRPRRIGITNFLSTNIVENKFYKDEEKARYTGRVFQAATFVGMIYDASRQEPPSLCQR